jgi:hypothetical protein
MLLLLVVLLLARSVAAQDTGIITRLPEDVGAHPGDTLRLPVSIMNFAGAIAGWTVEYVLSRPGLAVLDNTQLYDTSGSFSSGWEHVGASMPSSTDVRITGIADLTLDHTPPPFSSTTGTVVSVVVHIPCDADTISGTNVTMSPNGQQQFSSPQGQLLSPVAAYGGTIHVRSIARGDIDYSGALDVVDVIAEVNCAFRGNCPNCAGVLADVDCDGDNDIVDVVLLIGAAFRGQPLTPCH